MDYYKRITIWDNKKRIELLNNFKELVIAYFENIEYPAYSLGEYSENDEARKIRSEINMIMDKIHSVVILAGGSLTVFQAPPPAIGGIAGNIDLLHNIFNLYRFQIPEQQLLDHIEIAIGIYKNDTINALLRTYNPFFWLGLILEYIVRLPFKIFGKVGFNQQKIESSLTAKIVKIIFYFIIIFETLTTIIERMGYLPKFILLINKLFRY